MRDNETRILSFIFRGKLTQFIVRFILIVVSDCANSVSIFQSFSNFLFRNIGLIIVWINVVETGPLIGLTMDENSIETILKSYYHSFLLQEFKRVLSISIIAAGAVRCSTEWLLCKTKFL